MDNQFVTRAMYDAMAARAEQAEAMLYDYRNMPSSDFIRRAERAESALAEMREVIHNARTLIRRDGDAVERAWHRAAFAALVAVPS